MADPVRQDLVLLCTHAAKLLSSKTAVETGRRIFSHSDILLYIKE